MLRVYHSNRLEKLLDRLIEVTAEPAGFPLSGETIITQSQGMARWLALGIAEKTGIAANLEFVLPAAFIWRMFVDQLPGLTETAAFDRRTLAWRIMATLPELTKTRGFGPLEDYLAGERTELRRWQLCRQIADVFDQYLIYRPDMLMQWEKGQDDDWQSQLWRALCSAAESRHRAALWQEFLNRFEHGLIDRDKLPPRLVVFGIPTLPPANFEVLRRIADLTEVHLMVLNPCLGYWGDIEEYRKISRLRNARGRTGDEDYYATGNPLLASFGRLGRDFIDMLQGVPCVEEELFVPHESDRLLSRLQNDILTLTDRSQPDAEKWVLGPEDRTVRIHSCHSPMREVEVLHDQLLALFDSDPTLQPQDVVVMTPTIEDYAPYIDAVFGTPHEAGRIPFSIADLSRQSEHPVVQAFVQLIDASTGRFPASEILSLLENHAVLARFGFSQTDYETIRGWVRESGIRWGFDGASRRCLGLPEADHNTWDFGFRRLFLGYALPPAETLFRDVLPYGHVEGQSAAALGRLRSFVECLASFGKRLEGSYTAQEWAALLNEMLEVFFAEEEDAGVSSNDGARSADAGSIADALQIIREAVSALVEEAERADYTAPFGLELMRDFLRGQFGETNTGQFFLSGRVTFCAMIPMRSIPFRVVCLLGMGDQAFPRSRRPVGFDKIAEKPRAGDRSRREDDLYLFLEAMLSARDIFYVSYIGRNIRDNNALLPSVLVNELIDYIASATGCDSSTTRGHLVVEHPLQPFNARYFDGRDPALFSYADEWLSGVAAHQSAGETPALFLPSLLSEVAPTLLELEQLIEFFHHPPRTLLLERLGLHLASSEEVVQDSEPFAPEQRTIWRLKAELLQAALQGEEPASYQARAVARGELPPGAFGDLRFREPCDVAMVMADKIESLDAEPLPPLEVTLRLNGLILTGWLHDRTTKGLLHHRAAKITARDRLEAWIRHLALNATASAESERTSFHVGENGIVIFSPVEDACARLEQLVSLYQEGMRAPLPFMPASAMAYVEARIKNSEKALDAARARWAGNAFQPGDGSDEYARMAFRGTDPVGERFEAIAMEIFGSMFAHMKDQ